MRLKFGAFASGQHIIGDAFGNLLADSVTQRTSAKDNTQQGAKLDEESSNAAGFSRDVARRKADDVFDGYSGTRYSRSSMAKYDAGVGGGSSGDYAGKSVIDEDLAYSSDAFEVFPPKFEPPIEVTVLPPIDVSGNSKTGSRGAASAGPSALSRLQSSNKEYWQEAKNNATNPASYIGAHFGGLLNETGVELLQTGASLIDLATNRQTQINAMKGIQYAATHPGVVANAVVDGAVDFANKPFGEQADSLFKFGTGAFATAGGGKVVGFAGDLTYQGALKTAQMLGPTADAMVYKGLKRSGLVLNVVEDTGVGPNKLKLSFLTPDDFSNLPRAGTIDPRVIRYSQDSVSESFKKPYGSVDDFVKDLRSGNIKSGSIEPIRIVERDGKIFTLDNRRLYSYQQAKIEIPYVKLDSIPKRELFKFTTKNDGTSIEIRKGKQ